jgi:hypothetical protein
LKLPVHFKPGTIYAGINRPFFASRGAVRSEVRKLPGVGAVRFYERKKTALPLNVNPKRDPLYQDNWDEWVAIEYEGPDRVVQLDRQWKWLLLAPKQPGEVFPKDPAALNPELTPDEPGGNSSFVNVLLLFPWIAVATVVRYKRRQR